LSKLREASDNRVSARLLGTARREQRGRETNVTGGVKVRRAVINKYEVIVRSADDPRNVLKGTTVWLPATDLGADHPVANILLESVEAPAPRRPLGHVIREAGDRHAKCLHPAQEMLDPIVQPASAHVLGVEILPMACKTKAPPQLARGILAQAAAHIRLTNRRFRLATATLADKWDEQFGDLIGRPEYDSEAIQDHHSRPKCCSPVSRSVFKRHRWNSLE
jgi:hypothetical protein